MSTDATLYDCGSHGMLSRTDIIRITGLSRQTIYCRLRSGLRGDALCARPSMPEAEAMAHLHTLRLWPAPSVPASLCPVVGVRHG